MRKEITIKDIAREAKVSVATVSHVINNTKNVTERTRNKVIEVVKKYNYVPNTAARNLRQQTTKTLALVVSSFLDTFVTRMINGIETRAKEAGYKLLLVITNEDSEYEKETIKLLYAQHVDGIILSPTSGDLSYLNEYLEQEFPIIMVNRYLPELDSIPHVIGDNYQIGYDSTQHLINHGHTKIGFVYTFPNVSTTDDRVHGYKKALEENEIEYDESLCIQGFADARGGEIAAEQLITHSKATAALIQNDQMTIGVIDKLTQEGLTIPDDMALIGFGDFAAAHILNSPVTTINLPAETIGETAVDLFLNKINNPKYKGKVVLPGSIKLRESCGCHPFK